MSWRGTTGVLLAASLGVACRSGEISTRDRNDQHAPPAASAHQQRAAEVGARPARRGASKASAARANAAPDWGWGDAIEWHDFSDAERLAKSEGRPIFLLVYAKWCGQCRALAPTFARPEIAELAKHFVMARQDHDQQPEWLERVVPGTGSYVPRIYFLDPDGSLRREITSGNSRFPYFYPPGQPRALLASLNRALDRNAVPGRD